MSPITGHLDDFLKVNRHTIEGDKSFRLTNRKRVHLTMTNQIQQIFSPRVSKYKYPQPAHRDSPETQQLI